MISLVFSLGLFYTSLNFLFPLEIRTELLQEYLIFRELLDFQFCERACSFENIFKKS